MKKTLICLMMLLFSLPMLAKHQEKQLSKLATWRLISHCHRPLVNP